MTAANNAPIIVPYRPRFPQTEIHKELESHRFNVLVAHRRLGKSVMAINHTIKKAAMNVLRLPRYAFIAPFLKQAKMIAWDYLKRYAMPIPGTTANEAELSITFPTKARISLFGADNPEAMRGTYFDGVVLDEYGQFKKGIYSEIIRATLVDRKGWALFDGTPKGQNEFFEVYQQALREIAAKNTEWWAGLYRADQTGVIPEEELKQLQGLGSRIYRQEFLCDFTAADDDVLIPIDLVIAACERIRTARELIGAPKIIGVDPARFGDDKSVIVRRQGLAMFQPKILSKIDNMTLVGHISKEINDWNPDAVFIDAGRGEGVIDRLRQLGFEVQEINFGGTSLTSTMYHNRRAEMWDKMREWLEQGGTIPNVPELKAELPSATYDFDAANRMRLEEKDDIKERLGRSPDIADALALTFAMPVRARDRENGLVQMRSRMEFGSPTPYDPSERK